MLVLDSDDEPSCSETTEIVGHVRQTCTHAAACATRSNTAWSSMLSQLEGMLGRHEPRRNISGENAEEILFALEEQYLCNQHRQYDEDDDRAASIIQAVFRGVRQREQTLRLIQRSKAAKQIVQRRDFAAARAKLDVDVSRDEWEVFANGQFEAWILSHGACRHRGSCDSSLRNSSCQQALRQAGTFGTADRNMMPEKIHGQRAKTLPDVETRNTPISNEVRSNGERPDSAAIRKVGSTQRVQNLYAMHVGRMQRLSEMRMETEKTREEDEMAEMERLRNWRNNFPFSKSVRNTSQNKPAEIRLIEWGNDRKIKRNERQRIADERAAAASTEQNWAKTSRLPQNWNNCFLERVEHDVARRNESSKTRQKKRKDAEDAEAKRLLGRFGGNHIEKNKIKRLEALRLANRERWLRTKRQLEDQTDSVADSTSTISKNIDRNKSLKQSTIVKHPAAKRATGNENFEQESSVGSEMLKSSIFVQENDSFKPSSASADGDVGGAYSCSSWNSKTACVAEDSDDACSNDEQLSSAGSCTPPLTPRDQPVDILRDTIDEAIGCDRLKVADALVEAALWREQGGEPLGASLDALVAYACSKGWPMPGEDGFQIGNAPNTASSSIDIKNSDTTEGNFCDNQQISEFHEYHQLQGLYDSSYSGPLSTALAEGSPTGTPTATGIHDNIHPEPYKFKEGDPYAALSTMVQERMSHSFTPPARSFLESEPVPPLEPLRPAPVLQLDRVTPRQTPDFKSMMARLEILTEQATQTFTAKTSEGQPEPCSASAPCQEPSSTDRTALNKLQAKENPVELEKAPLRNVHAGNSQFHMQSDVFDAGSMEHRLSTSDDKEVGNPSMVHVFHNDQCDEAKVHRLNASSSENEEANITDPLQNLALIAARQRGIAVSESATLKPPATLKRINGGYVVLANTKLRPPSDGSITTVQKQAWMARLVFRSEEAFDTDEEDIIGSSSEVLPS